MENMGKGKRNCLSCQEAEVSLKGKLRDYSTNGGTVRKKRKTCLLVEPKALKGSPPELAKSLESGGAECPHMGSSEEPLLH